MISQQTSVFSKRSKLSRKEQAEIKAEQERLADEERYKLIFGTADFEFRSKRPRVTKAPSMMTQRNNETSTKRSSVMKPISKDGKANTAFSSKRNSSLTAAACTSPNMTKRESRLSQTSSISSARDESELASITSVKNITPSSNLRATFYKKEPQKTESKDKQQDTDATVPDDSQGVRPKYPPRKNIRINTLGVFVEEGSCPLPPGYIDGRSAIKSQSLTEKPKVKPLSALDKSAFKRRFVYNAQ